MPHTEQVDTNLANSRTLRLAARGARTWPEGTPLAAKVTWWPYGEPYHPARAARTWPESWQLNRHAQEQQAPGTFLSESGRAPRWPFTRPNNDTEFVEYVRNCVVTASCSVVALAVGILLGTTLL